MATEKTENVSYPEFRRAGGERPRQVLAEQVPPTAEAETANTTNAKLRAALSEAVALLQPAQEEIERLRAQLLEVKEAHRMAAVELLAVEMREAGARAESNDALADRTDLQRQALREEILRQEEQRQRPWWRLGW